MDMRKIPLVSSIIFILIILVLLINLKLMNSAIHQTEVPSFSSIYLYHSDSVVSLEPGSRKGNTIVKEIMYLMHHNDLLLGNVDGSITLHAGHPMDKDYDGYCIEITFSEPHTFSLVGNKQTNISTLFFTLEDNCFYLFKSAPKDNSTSFAGYMCKKDSFLNLTSFAKKYFFQDT